MKVFALLSLFSILFFSCTKCDPQKVCDIQRTYSENAAKVTISNGIWGTVSSMEGNCMPIVPPSSLSCTNCPVNRTVLIYEYTLESQATPSGISPIFFNSFNTQLVAQSQADNDGFFQASVPAGRYSIAIMENGKLYANEQDGSGGLNPIQYSSGLQNVNLVMNYKATF